MSTQKTIFGTTEERRNAFSGACVSVEEHLLESHGPLPACADKWLLSSAMQKFIRRGMAVQSIAAAIRLHLIDPAYLRRRLPVVALEEVGPASLQVCSDVLHVCRSSAWWVNGALETVVSLVGALAEATKSRSACDLYCLVESHPSSLVTRQLLSLETAAVLIDVAVDSSRPNLDRAIALQLLASRSKNPQFVSECLDRVSTAVGVPAEFQWLVGCNSKTAGLAAMLPIAFNVSRESSVGTIREFPHAMSTIGGIPLCAVDKHTRVGKTSLSIFYRSSKLLQDFLQVHGTPGKNHGLVSVGLFQAESSLLDAYLISPKLGELRRQCEEAELREAGLTEPTHHEAFIQLLSDEAERLSDIRRQCLKSSVSLA